MNCWTWNTVFPPRQRQEKKKGLVHVQGSTLQGSQWVLCERQQLPELHREELASRCHLFTLENQVCVL